MLFDRENEDFASDVATRALSVTAVENAFVNRVYEKLAKVYDLIFGPTLHHGRLVAIERMAIKPGDRILEVGVGTGINTSLYPTSCSVTGIDLSASMLEKARERVRREGLRHVRLQEMDAANLIFADDTFDIVYAPYLVSVVPDPVQVVKEMRRVCKPGERSSSSTTSVAPTPYSHGSNVPSLHSPSTSGSNPISICRGSSPRRLLNRCRSRR